METLLILIGIAALLVCLLLTLVVLLVYSGLFETIEIGAGRPPVGEAVIAYKFARGPYKEVGPLFTEVSKIAPDNKCLGIYYDDPKKVEAHRLRYAVACILAEGCEKVDEEIRHKFEAEGFRVTTLPYVENAVRTKFPFISTLSIFIAVSRVYPKLAEYIEEHKLCAHPFLEIYEGKTIYFMAPLSKQQEFYVPESLKQYAGEVPYESYYPDSADDALQSDLTPTYDESVNEPSLLDIPRCMNVPEEHSEKEAGKASGEAALAFSATATKEKDGQGSDEDSTSSFEEVKMENPELSQR